MKEVKIYDNNTGDVFLLIFSTSTFVIETAITKTIQIT